MRLYDELKFVKGVGPKRANQFAQLNVHSVRDFLSILPRSYLTKQHAVKLSQLKENDYVTVFGKIVNIQMKFGKRKRIVITISDGTGLCQGVWFNYISSIESKFKSGMEVAFSGKIGYFNGFQIVHPEVEIVRDEKDTLTHRQAQSEGEKEIIVPIYPLPDVLRKANISNTTLRKIVSTIFEELVVDDIEEILPQSLLDKYGFKILAKSLQDIHLPDQINDAELGRKRFRYQELLLLQLYLLLKKSKSAAVSDGIVFENVGVHFSESHKAFPFELTKAQKRVIKEIRRDMKQAIPMNRLVQGDVGSGKTIVALLCMAIAADNNYQSVFMAPTEILAEQHYKNIYDITKNTGLRITLLTGKLKEKIKTERLRDIQNGMIDIIVGTHAVIQDQVMFANLGLVVIDEQHRFGVMQRAKLVEKGGHPDVLVMTATPIPRTMALTVYGDLDISILDEKPAGRKEIKTLHRYYTKVQMTYDFIRENVKLGEQAYFVFPLIEESEKMDLKSVTESYEKLSKHIFPEFNVGLLHGKMSSDDKDVVMSQFKQGQIQILLSTTVIEVGVDIPNATMMVIENADRFGLSQLHQLRGRVGRSNKQSYCILMTEYAISQDAKLRMDVMTRTNDGFVIAEEDLNIRGIGDLFGTKQSGFSDFNWAALLLDKESLNQARHDAEEILGEDPHLRKPEHLRLRNIVLNELSQRYGLMDIA